jgi:hypothetical protein
VSMGSQSVAVNARLQHVFLSRAAAPASVVALYITSIRRMSRDDVPLGGLSGRYVK